MSIDANIALEGMPIPRISGILFDMDGVLINSEPLHEFTLLELSSQFGRRFESKSELQQFKGLPETSIACLFRKLFPSVTLASGEITRLRLEQLRANFHSVQMIEGALKFVKRCKAAGLRVGLTTSAAQSIQQLAFETFQLAGYFDAAITGEDIERGKPDPEPYLLTAEKLGIPTSACIVIEDAISGILSGKAAGSFVVGITTSFTRNALVSAGADLVVPSFSVLEDHIFETCRLAEDR